MFLTKVRMFHSDNKQQLTTTKQFPFAMSASKNLDAESGQSLLTEYHICPNGESKESRDILQWYISVFKIAIWGGWIVILLILLSLKLLQ